ncbi:MAG: class I SAM-dependent methyltransferase [Flavobacteriales bacterium]|jgi:SAM-dependent methyltransferase|nr:class I SAM-dependent methyltransferase [Flavobacteriales bacterium]
MKDGIPLSAILQWEVRSWSRALPLWEQYLPKDRTSRVLGIGEREGGLSLWFAAKGYTVVCTDLRPFPEGTRELHERYGVQDRVIHQQADTTALPFPDQSFTCVFFKSVIGALGTKEAQLQAVREMHRVLKPGGVLLFAENLHGSCLHGWLRERYVSWSSYWRYLHIEQDRDLFAPFAQVHASTTGVVANLGRTEAQRDLLARMDVVLTKLIPRRMHTIWYGAAIKG